LAGGVLQQQLLNLDSIVEHEQVLRVAKVSPAPRGASSKRLKKFSKLSYL
jgi:hypothetical protein